MPRPTQSNLLLANYCRRYRCAQGRVVFAVCLFLLIAFFVPLARAQERPYIVTYDHYLEEPGSLEIEYFSTFGAQRGGRDFHSYWVELEYGVNAWYTTELYLDGQTTFGDGSVFTGFRWENRVRMLQRE